MRLWIAALALMALTGPSAAASWRESVAAALIPTSDTALEQMVRAAYTGASAFATAHGNYFARDGVFPPLHDAVAAELASQGFAGVAVIGPAEGDVGKGCLAGPGAELRIGTNIYGDGVSLVAASSKRLFVYAYDPHVAADVVVTPAADCGK